MASLDADIDRLYQVPPTEFTSARNALAAKSGSDRDRIRRLEKPALPAWAVNQLYWKKPRVYEALVERAGELREAHKAVLGGRRADIRSAGRAHDESVEAALKETLDLLAESGQKATETTRQAIAQTLRALPSADAPGRLTQPLKPGGFEMLAGITPGGGASRARSGSSQPAENVPASARVGRAATRKGRQPGDRAGARELARARDAATAAARQLREAEQQVRQDEFEKARTARAAAKTLARLQAAREAVASAQQELDEAERAHNGAERARESAERRAGQSAAAVAEAQDRADAAQRALDAITSPSSRDR